MQSPPYHLNKELPIPNGSPNSRRPSNNHRKGRKNAANGLKTKSSRNNLFVKFNVLNPLKTQPTTSTRADPASPFRIVHTPDRTPLYVPPGLRGPKTSVECREALEEMHAVSRSQQQREKQRYSTDENGDHTKTGLQMHPSNSYQHHRYVSIIQNRKTGHLEEDEMVWIRMRPGDLKKRVRQRTDLEDSSFSSSRNRNSGDGSSNKRPPRRPPPPLPLRKDTKHITTPRSMLPSGKLHIPPPPSTPNSAGPALETIPASPASPSTPTTTTATSTTTTTLSWRGPASAGFPPTPPMPSLPRGNTGRGRAHKRIVSTGSQPALRAPRPLSERPLIPLGGCAYPPVMSPPPQRPMTAASGRSDLSPSRSPPVDFSKTATAPTRPTFGRVLENPHEESPIELRRYDELTNRRSKPRIPVCSVTEGGDFQIMGDGEDMNNSQNSNHSNDGESWSGSENLTPVITATRNRPGISILTSATPENRCFICATPIASYVEICDGNCQAYPLTHQGGDEHPFEYSDSEYDETSPGQRTLSPKMGFPLSPITPTKPLRCGGAGGGNNGEAPLTPTRSPRFPPASSNPSVGETKTFSRATTMGWSRASSPTRQPGASPTNRSFSSLSAPPTPSLPEHTTLNATTSSRPFSPHAWFSPGLRKGSASSTTTTTTTTSTTSYSSVLGSANEQPSSALFHLERSIMHDPSWSPLVPGSSMLPAGHEVLRLGRVPSGEGHQVVVFRAESVDCSSRESSGASGNSIGGEENGEVEGSEGEVEGVHKRGSAASVPGPFGRKEGGEQSDVLSNSTDNDGNVEYRGHDGGIDHQHHHHHRYNNIINAKNEKREAGGSYGDWFSYYAEETRQNNAVAAARYVHLIPFSSVVPFTPEEEESASSRVSPITNCESFSSDHSMGNTRRRIMMLEAAAIQREKEEEQLRQLRRPLAATTTTVGSRTPAGVIMRSRRRSSIYDRIQSIYDAYADLSGEDEGGDDAGEAKEGARYGLV